MDRLEYFIETCEITVFRQSWHLHPTVILGVGVVLEKHSSKVFCYQGGTMGHQSCLL